jgi:hypothetical protein
MLRVSTGNGSPTLRCLNASVSAAEGWAGRGCPHLGRAPRADGSGEPIHLRANGSDATAYFHRFDASPKEIIRQTGHWLHSHSAVC